MQKWGLEYTYQLIKKKIYIRIIFQLSLIMQNKQSTKKKYRRKDDESTIVHRSTKHNEEYQTLEVHDLQHLTQPKIKECTYDFGYKYNQYLRFILIKILPLRESDRIRIIKQQGKIKMIGHPSQCEKLLQKINNQLSQFVAKMITFKNQADIEEIQFQLNKKYHHKIYTKKYIQLCVKEAQKCFGFKQEGLDLLQRLEDNRILIRVLKKFADQCIEQIQKILKSQTSKGKNVHSMISHKIIKKQSSDQQEIIEDVNEHSYYQLKRNSQKQQQKHSRSVTNIFQKLPEPTEDDSVSVAEYKRQKNTFNKNKKEDKQIKTDIHKNKMKIIKQYIFEGQSFDVIKFKNWLHSQRHVISEHNIKIESSKDPYSQNQDEQYQQHKIKLIIQDNHNQQQQQKLIECLQLYLKFKKVIFVKLKNQKYKKEIIQSYAKDEEHLKIEFIKGYKSPKWDQKSMWRHITRKAYTDSKKNTHSQYFQAFYFEGIKSLVLQSSDQIKKKIDHEPLDDIQQQIDFKIPGTQDAIRDNAKLKKLILSHIEIIIKEYYTHICKIKQIKFVLAGISLRLLVKCDKQNTFKSRIKADIEEKIIEQLKFITFTGNCIFDKTFYDKLQQSFVILQKGEKQFKFVTTSKQVGESYQAINKLINDFNIVGQIQIVVKDEMIVKKVEDYLQKLISESEYSDIKYHYHNQHQKIKIYGRNSLVQSLNKKVNSFISQVELNMISYVQILDEKQGQLLKNSPILSTMSKDYEINIKISNTQMSCKLILSKQQQNYIKKTLRFIKAKSLHYAPYESFIIFQNINEVEFFNENYFIKTYKNYIKKHSHNKNAQLLPYNEHTRGYIIYMKETKSYQAIFKSILSLNNKKRKNIVFIMPQTQKNDFVKSIISLLIDNKQFYGENMVLHFLQPQDNIDFKKQFKFPAYNKGLKKQKKKDQLEIKYFIEDNANKFYYSENGNKKIATALSKGFSQVILYNQDLNLTHISHTFQTANLSIVHGQSGKSFPLKFINNSIYFTLKNQQYEVPTRTALLIKDSIKNKTPSVQISLGVYEINISQMKQINLFSDYVRALKKQELLIKANIYQQNTQAFYDVKCAQVTYSYANEQKSIKNLGKSIQDIQKFIQSQYKTLQISVSHLKNIQEQDIQNIRYSIGEDSSLQFRYDKINKKIVIRTLDESNISRYKQIAQILLKNLDNKDPNKIVYPSLWQPQNNQIQIFPVDPTSYEFAHVQKLFTVNKIKELLRIQNKIIYKKFYEEGLFLQQLNGCKIKKRELFHGTRATNPEQIYNDKQESFNINYSSDNNLLGKGIYFAQKSQYSDGYKHTEIKSNGIIFGLGAQNVYSMFLCDVYVGDSQKCLKHDGNIKDTLFKDTVKKIRYESMTDYLNNSNIFVVYKSRRAYPLYLIKY